LAVSAVMRFRRGLVPGEQVALIGPGRHRRRELRAVLLDRGVDGRVDLEQRAQVIGPGQGADDRRRQGLGDAGLVLDRRVSSRSAGSAPASAPG
jgi:hypothetical protein